MKILLAIDGSQFGEIATQAITSQFHPQDTDVLVLQVVEPLHLMTDAELLVPELTARALEHARYSTTTAVQKLQSAGFKAEPRVVENEVRSAILDIAEHWHADLIVLGSHGRTGIARFLLGSIAESVARHAHCSVYIARRASEL